LVPLPFLAVHQRITITSCGQTGGPPVSFSFSSSSNKLIL
jgi:hypothetical protein